MNHLKAKRKENIIIIITIRIMQEIQIFLQKIL